MARPTDTDRILKALVLADGRKATHDDLAIYLGWTLEQTLNKVKRGVQAGLLFYSATTGMVTRKRKSHSPDKGKVKSRRATTTRRQAKTSVAPREQLELPLVVTQTVTESANG